MATNIKSNLCQNLINNNLVKQFDVIQHSYTDNGERDMEKTIVSTNGIFPCITTRPDVLGVVVKWEKQN